MPPRTLLNTALAALATAAVTAASPSPLPRVSPASAPGVASPVTTATTAREATPAHTSQPRIDSMAPPASPPPTGISAVLSGARAAVTRTAPLGPSLLGIAIVAAAAVYLVRRVRRLRGGP